LKPCDFSNAILDRATFINSDLSGVRFDGASLLRTRFVSCYLDGSSFKGSVFGGTVFAGLDLSVVRGLDTTDHTGPSFLDLDTMLASQQVPTEFLRGCGVSETIISNLPLLTVQHSFDYFSCFISYSHEDSGSARRLYDRLQALGIRCWLDKKQLLPSDSLYEHIDRGIRNWNKFLLCYSRNSLKPSSWVDKEIVTALEKEDELTRTRGQVIRTLIPLNLDGTCSAKTGRAVTVPILAGLSQMRWCFSHAAGFLSACGASSRLDERIPGIQRSS
jgi:hypothetical protein